MTKKIPNQWVEKSISSLGTSFNGLTGKSGDDFLEGDPFLTYLQIFNNQVDDKTLCGRVRVSPNERQNKVKYGDILFTTSSETFQEVGYSSVFLSKNYEPYLNSFCFGIRLNNFESLYPPYAKYLFKGQSFRQQMIRLAQGSTRYNLSKTEFMKTVVQLPPIHEQKKISEILMTVDDSVNFLEKLIVKLKDLRCGLLFDFLSAGFKKSLFTNLANNSSAGWAEVRIGDLIEKVIDNRGKTPPVSKSAEYPLLEVGSISTESKYPNYELVTKFVDQNVYTKSFRAGHPIINDILVPTVGSIGQFAILKENRGCIAQNIIAIRPNKLVDPEFLYYLLNGHQVQRGISAVLMGAVQPSLRVPHFLDILVSIPSPDEQIRIRKILSSIDERIDCARAFLLKRKLLKKSLLQDLLIGKVRVKVN